MYLPFHGIVFHILLVFRRSNHYLFLHNADVECKFSSIRFSNDSFQLWFGIKILRVLLDCYCMFSLAFSGVGTNTSALCMPFNATFI